ncbi:hypothetical protein BKA69DRAFT_1123336 [Paraphysoderma sedebokerense]|nr:hypothetical protein BKA69DRAFT_1123336 [Paraphysoderma sedebokerense]
MSEPETRIDEKETFEDANEEIVAEERTQMNTANTTSQEEADRREPKSADSTPQVSTSPSVQKKDPRSVLDSLSETPSTSSQNEASGGWGWASWGASILTTAVKTIEQNVDVNTLKTTAERLGTNIKSVTTEGLDKVYGTLDPDFEKEKQRSQPESAENDPEKSEPTEGREQSLTTEDLKQTAAEATETVLQTIDKTFDFATDLLGNAVLTGYKFVNSESSKLSQRVEGIKSQADKSELVHQSKEVSEKAVKDGLGALEFLGKKAMDVINETRKPLLQTPGQNASASWSAESKKPKTPAAITLKSLFEDNCGNAHLQALEMLSTESFAKFTSISGSLASNAVFQTDVETLEKNFDVDEVVEALEESEENILETDEAVEELVSLLTVMGLQKSTSSSQSKQLQAVIRKIEGSLKTIKDSAEENLASFESSADKNEAVKQSLEATLDKLRLSSLHSLADFAEKGCEQILRLAEIFLMRIAELKMASGDQNNGKESKSAEELDAVALSEKIRELVVKLLTETQYICVVYVNFVDDLSKQYKEWVDYNIGESGKNVEELLKLVESKGQLFNNNLFTEVGTSMSFIQEAMASILNIVKLLLAQSHSAKAKS